MSHESTDPALYHGKFIENVIELVKLLKQNQRIYDALSSVLWQVVRYDSLHKMGLFPSYGDEEWSGRTLLDEVRDSVTDDHGNPFYWVFLCRVFTEAEDPIGHLLRQQDILNYVDRLMNDSATETETMRRWFWDLQAKIRGWNCASMVAAGQVPIVPAEYQDPNGPDVGFVATILMLGFVQEVADPVEQAAMECNCRFVAVTDHTGPKQHSFIMCAIRALGSAYSESRKTKAGASEEAARPVPPHPRGARVPTARGSGSTA